MRRLAFREKPLALDRVGNRGIGRRLQPRGRPMTGKLYAEAIAHTPMGDRPFVVRGQTGKALIALVNGGDRGVTALEAATWAYRFAAYCFELRTRYGLAIRTEREEHPGGWHGRHVLETPVKILFVADPEQEVDAA
jgi:hypothetical protein